MTKQKKKPTRYKFRPNDNYKTQKKKKNYYY